MADLRDSGQSIEERTSEPNILKPGTFASSQIRVILQGKKHYVHVSYEFTWAQDYKLFPSLKDMRKPERISLLYMA